MFVSCGYWLVLLAVYSVALADFEVSKDNAVESDSNKFVDNDSFQLVSECYCGKHGNCTLSASGTKYCQCESGYENESGFCEDIDECVRRRPCITEHSFCINTPGSYRCDCENGYSVMKDGYNDKFNSCQKESNPWEIAWIVVGSLCAIVMFVLLMVKCSKYMDPTDISKV